MCYVLCVMCYVLCVTCYVLCVPLLFLVIVHIAYTLTQPQPHSYPTIVVTWIGCIWSWFCIGSLTFTSCRSLSIITPCWLLLGWLASSLASIDVDAPFPIMVSRKHICVVSLPFLLLHGWQLTNSSWWVGGYCLLLKWSQQTMKIRNGVFVIMFLQLLSSWQ